MTSAARLHATVKTNPAKTSAVPEVTRNPLPAAKVATPRRMPDISAQLDHAARFGHHFEDINIFRPDHPIQRMINLDSTESNAAEATPNHTGLPTRLKAGIESLSGIDLSDVHVHENSVEPTRIGALAYTQGSQIYLGPDQAWHLPHEAWHVVQQRQGRVQPTLHAKGLAINDDQGLEREADQMGTIALSGTVPLESLAHTFLYSTNQSAVQRTVIQRKVGFEFEDADWIAWINPYIGAQRPAKRHEILHKGTHFNLEADDSNGPNAASIEFVTKPFEVDANGLAELTAAMTAIGVIMTRIGGHAPVPQGAFLIANQHQFSNSRVRLSDGNANGRFKMQATQGVSLEDIPTVMKTFGTNVPSETVGENADRWNARGLLFGNQVGTDVSNVLGSAPTLAAHAITRLNNAGAGLNAAQRGYFAAHTEALLGFLTQIIIYVKMLSVSETGYAKYKLPFLNRTEFATMFKLLPNDQRQALAQNNAQALTDAVVFAANHTALIPILPQHGGGFYDIGFADNGALFRNFRPNDEPYDPITHMRRRVFTSLTIQEWLNGVTHGTDYLTPSKMSSWLKANEPNLTSADRARQIKRLESLNSLRKKTNAGAPGRTRQVIMENRIIAPNRGNPQFNGHFTHPQAQAAALNYLQFFIQIHQLGQNPGAFP